MGRIKKGCLGLALILLVLVVCGLVVAWVQGRKDPVGQPTYVALGSSFAAGAGLGPLQKGSPWLCARSVGGYPQVLARKTGLPIVDMSCGGAVTRHLLKGGQVFQGPQLRAVTSETRLVTITVGGNDIGYVGDLSNLAARHTGTLYSWLVRRVWRGPSPADERDYATLRSELVATLRTIRRQSPDAVIVVATYPTIVPPSGTCPQIGLDEREAALMRDVGNRLASTTRAAAREGGAILVDMNALGVQHNACSKSPWTNGWANGGIAPFHPTAAGARATADAILQALKRSPAGVAAISKDDAAGHQARRVGRQEQHD